MVAPGGDPNFVATIDSSAFKAPPSPPNHPLVTANLVEGLSSPQSLVIDNSNGDIYAFEANGTRIARFTPAGAPDNFTVGPGAGTNKIGGLENELGSGTYQVAVDNAPGSPFNGDIYATNEFGITVFSPTGANIGSFSTGGFDCGVSVDQSNGAVYVGDALSERIFRFFPTGSAPVTSADYTVTSISPNGILPCQTAADKVGHVYAKDFSSNKAQLFNAPDFSAAGPSVVGTTVSTNANAIGTDAANNDLYVNEGSQIARYASSGGLIQKFGSTYISNSRGVAVNAASKHVYAPNGSKIVEFGFEPSPYHPIDNSAVLNGVRQAGVHDFEDFQVSANGHFALFGSALPLQPGYTNAGHFEVYRYDTTSGSLKCASCAPSNATASGDSHLPAYGLGLTEDGRVFFNSTETLVLRDTNEKEDAYEWNDGTVQLISTGASKEDSKLMTVTPGGKDAFFFTRETLAREDENGSTIKIYDARTGGGFPYDRPPFPCAASDECHGAGTQSPAPPDIHTQVPSQASPFAVSTVKSCRKDFVRRHGKCVKRHHKKHNGKRPSTTRRHG